MSEKETRNGLTFSQWLVKVDANLDSRIGLGIADLSDFNSYDAWSDEMTPREGADECLANDDTYCDSGL